MKNILKNKHLLIRKLLHLSIIPIWFILTAVNISSMPSLISMICSAVIINILLLYYSIKTKRFGQISFGLILTLLIWIVLLTNRYFLEFTIILCVMSISDGFSTIIPTLLGEDKTHKIISKINNKTLEGCIVFYILTSIIFIIAFKAIIFSLITAILLTLVEYLSDNPIVKFDDNINIFIFMLLIFILRGI